jgi:succinate dehydrogenase / fumarate reductase flavoprotein subunit
MIYYLEHLGVPFSRTNDGKIFQRYFGGHYSDFGKGPPVRRACMAADRIGHAILHTLFGQCLKQRLKFYNEFLVTHLLFHDEGCCGCVAWDLIKGEIHIFNAKLLLLATGGYARLFQFSTNSAINSGDGLGMILERGLPLEDMEFVQFHPTGPYPWGFLMTEGIRSEGGHLLNQAGERFMQRYAPKKMELAPRDVIARAIQKEIEAGRGIKGKPYVYLDIRYLPEEVIYERLPQIKEMALKFGGINVKEALIPVAPAAHYSMGGIPINIDGEVLADGKKQIMPRLFAAGECACVSIHGANRLGTNSTIECAIFGERAGKKMGSLVKKISYLPLQKTQVYTAKEEINHFFSQPPKSPIGTLRKKLQSSMTQNCGILRHKVRLEKQITLIQGLKDAFKKVGLKKYAPTF